jgi:hypothetical protein
LGENKRGRLGRSDFETWEFPGDAAEFQHVIGDHSGAAFSRCQGDEHIIHRPEAVAQSGGVAMHGSKDSSGMAEHRGCEAKSTSGLKYLLNPAFLLLFAGCIPEAFIHRSRFNSHPVSFTGWTADADHLTRPHVMVVISGR